MNLDNLGAGDCEEKDAAREGPLTKRYGTVFTSSFSKLVSRE